MGPKFEDDGRKLAKHIPTSQGPTKVRRVISSWVFLIFQIITTLAQKRGGQTVGPWATGFYD